MAVSRGAEGLLAAAARGLLPPLRALVLVSPGAVTWEALGPSGEVPGTAAWTAGGDPVPWAPLPSGALMPQILRNAWRVGHDVARHRPSLLRLRPAYEAGLAAAGASAAAIDAGRVDCPLLMLAGSDDQVWPSGPMSQRLAAARRAAGVDGDDERVEYPGAGHLIRLGLLPTDAPWTSGIALGGEPAAQAAAQADATRRAIAFLARTPGPVNGPPSHGIQLSIRGAGRLRPGCAA
jgi:alpha-beta hydrolase superfamily lysophospholipase